MKADREALERELLERLHRLDIPGAGAVTHLTLLPGSDVNLAYPMPGGGVCRLLRDEKEYLCTQICGAEGEERCYGVAADEELMVVGRYGNGGADPELVLCWRYGICKEED